MGVSEPESTGRVQDLSTHLQQELSGPVEERAASAHQIASWRLWSQAQAITPARWWLHTSLLALTLVTTTVFGYALATSFASGHPIGEEFLSDGYSRLLHNVSTLRVGLAYSIPLLLILLAHELGHYFTCRYWDVEASLPYFGPAPTLLGTVGAFIRIRSPIYSRKSLFDIGVSGPLAGFALLAPFLFAGVLMSRVVPGGQVEGPFTFGTPLLLRAFEAVRFPGVAAGNISLHPMAMAAWAGLLATAINLLPVGQLDGGHISYALFGERGHRLLSFSLIAVMLVCGFLYWPWWLWAVAMFFFRRHPLIYDRESLGTRRHLLAVTALVLFVLSICIVPVR